MPKIWDAEDDSELRRLHAEGLSVGQTAKAMGRAKSTITTHSRRLGLSHAERAVQMEAAIQTSVMDRKARRAAIIDRLYRRAEAISDRLEAEGYEMLVNIGMGEQAPKRLDFVPGPEERALTGSIASLLAAAERLEKIDQDGGAAEVRGLVGTLMLNLEKVGSSLPPVDEQLAEEQQ